MVGMPWKGQGDVKGRLFVLATLVFVFFLLVILPEEAARLREATGGVSAPDTRFFYGKETLLRTAEAFGAEGRAYYIRSRLTFDVIWPLSYGFFLFFALQVVFQGQKRVHLNQGVFYTPVAAVLLDYTENVLISLSFLFYPEIPESIGRGAGIVTALKWGTIVLSFGMVVWGILRKIFFKIP